MFLVYSALGAAWALLCYRHKDELLPIQVSRPISYYDLVVEEDFSTTFQDSLAF